MICVKIKILRYSSWALSHEYLIRALVGEINWAKIDLHISQSWLPIRTRPRRAYRFAHRLTLQPKIQLSFTKDSGWTIFFRCNKISNTDPHLCWRVRCHIFYEREEEENLQFLIVIFYERFNQEGGCICIVVIIILNLTSDFIFLIIIIFIVVIILIMVNLTTNFICAIPNAIKLCCTRQCLSVDFSIGNGKKENLLGICWGNKRRNTKKIISRENLRTKYI